MSATSAPTKSLAEMIRSGPMVVAPGAYDCITARLIEQAGYPAVYMTGAGTSAAHGLPDYGLVTMSEMVENARRITSCISVPLVSDSDTGYGNELNAYRTVQEFERAGVSGIHIEDQVFPKKCGHLDDKELVSLEDYTAKIRAAAAARRSKDFLIIARTDARSVAGFDEAVRRANAAADAGADLIFLEAPQTLEEVAKVPQVVKAPCLLNMVLKGKTPHVNLKDAERMGYRLVIFDAFHDVAEKAKAGNSHAQGVLEAWAEAKWFERREPVPEAITLTVFKVPGETNTDDLSPAQDAWSRPDIPLHGLAMLKNPREGVENAIETIQQLKNKGHPVAYVGDVVGTGSSRKSAANSVIWHTGHDIPYVPNKRQGGVVIGTKIAPIFFNTVEDSGALPIECDVAAFSTGDVITVKPYEGKVLNPAGEVIAEFELRQEVLLDEVRAGGRIPLIIGRSLTDRARELLGKGPATMFRRPTAPEGSSKGYTLAQKVVGRACGVDGVRPGTYCEPRIATVGSQDTTGPMTRDELKELTCLGFSADLVLQTFCHTAA